MQRASMRVQGQAMATAQTVPTALSVVMRHVQARSQSTLCPRRRRMSIKAARIRRCRTCEFWRSAHADVWRWPRCVADGTERLELDNAFMESGACPVGRWDGLVPVDVDAARAAVEARKEEFERTGIGPVVAALVEGLDETAKAERLDVVVSVGLLTPAVAAEIMEGKVEPRGLDNAVRGGEAAARPS